MSRPGGSALAPPAGARGSSSTALPTSAPENPSLSRRRTGSGPEEPARRRESTPLATRSGAAFPPHRPPPFWLSSPAAAQLPAGKRSHGGLCLPAVRGARPAQPSPGPPRPEVSLRPAGRTAARTAAPGRGQLPRRGLGGRRCSCRLPAAPAAGLLALPLEQWGPDHAGRGAGRT